MEFVDSDWMPHIPASAPGAYHKDSTWPPAFLDGLQLAEEAPSAEQEPCNCSGMSPDNTRQSGLLVSCGSNAWSAAQSQQHGAVAPACVGPCVAAVTAGCSPETLPAANETFEQMLTEQVDSLLSSSDVPTAPNSVCSQLHNIDIVCQLGDHVTQEAAAGAATDCSLNSMAWLMGLNTAPPTAAHMAPAEPLSGYAAPWCPPVPAQVDTSNLIRPSTLQCSEMHYSWQAAAAGLHSPTGADAATQAAGSGQDAATLVSSAKRGASGSSALRGSSSSSSLNQLRSSSLTLPAFSTQTAGAAGAGAAARGGSSPVPTNVLPALSSDARREANKLNQRRQRQRRQDDMEHLRLQLSAMSNKHSEAKQKLETLRSENTDLLSRLSDITGKWQATVALNASLQHENAKSKTEVVDLQQQIRDMQAQLQQLQQMQMQQWNANMSWQQQQQAQLVQPPQQQVMGWAGELGPAAAAEQQHLGGW